MGKKLVQSTERKPAPKRRSVAVAAKAAPEGGIKLKRPMMKMQLALSTRMVSSLRSMSLTLGATGMVLRTMERGTGCRQLECT